MLSSQWEKSLWCRTKQKSRPNNSSAPNTCTLAVVRGHENIFSLILSWFHLEPPRLDPVRSKPCVVHLLVFGASCSCLSFLKGLIFLFILSRHDSDPPARAFHACNKNKPWSRDTQLRPCLWHMHGKVKYDDALPTVKCKKSVTADDVCHSVIHIHEQYLRHTLIKSQKKKKDNDICACVIPKLRPEARRDENCRMEGDEECEGVDSSCEHACLTETRWWTRRPSQTLH